MIHTCPYCNTTFAAHRKDKKYCSNSCKQLAFMKRQFACEFVLQNRQNVNKSEEQIVETSNGQNVNTSTDGSAMKGIEAGTINLKPLPDAVYKPVECKWINEIYALVRERENDEKLNYLLTLEEKANPVKWISIHYHCLLDCVITLSEINNIPWDDLAEITNAFTFLITSVYFKELPATYPFTKSIISFRDKLKSFCLATKQEEQMQFRLKFETKKALFLQRFELSLIFPTITFNQLQINFKNERTQP
jgi:hypothetical protein